MDTGNRVMGISPGTRTVGIAIFKDGKLRDWQLKTFTGKWSKIKQTWILSTLKQIIAQYGVSSIAVKIPHTSRTSKALNELTKAIQKLAEKQDLTVATFALKELEQVFSRSPKATKKEMIEQLVNHFPELQEYYEKTAKKSKNSFEKIFEAVALASILNE